VVRKFTEHNASGIDTNYYVDDKGVLLASERVQDVEAIIEENKRMQNGEKQVGNWRLTSVIPLIFVEKWLNEERERGNIGIKFCDEEYDKLVAKKLRDPDYKWLRTT